MIYNNQIHTSATYSNFVATAQAHNLTVAQRGQLYVLTETSNLTIVNPVQPNEFNDQNDNSIVSKLQTGNISFLFMGDSETPAEHSMLISSITSLQCDILKIGHHGSNTATSQSFLDIADPTYAIISVGLDNKYGHPHNETLQILRKKNVTTFCTMDSGTIIFQTNGNSILIPEHLTPIVISEIPHNLLFSVLVATLITVIFCKRKLTKNSNKL